MRVGGLDDSEREEIEDNEGIASEELDQLCPGFHFERLAGQIVLDDRGVRCRMIDEHFWSLTPIRKTMLIVHVYVLLPCIRPTWAWELLSFVLMDEYLPDDGIDSSL